MWKKVGKELYFFTHILRRTCSDSNVRLLSQNNVKETQKQKQKKKTKQVWRSKNVKLMILLIAFT